MNTLDLVHESVEWPSSPSLHCTTVIVFPKETAMSVPERDMVIETGLDCDSISENGDDDPSLKGNTPGPAGFQISDDFTRAVQQNRLLSIERPLYYYTREE